MLVRFLIWFLGFYNKVFKVLNRVFRIVLIGFLLLSIRFLLGFLIVFLLGF